MNRNETRVARLEEGAAEATKPCILVFADLGENIEDCIRRAGHEPDDPAKDFFVVQWVSPA